MCACVFQEYSEWKKGISDLSLPTVDINHMDHLTSYAQVVTDTTQELCELIVSSYKDKMNLTSKSGECTSYCVLVVLRNIVQQLLDGLLTVTIKSVIHELFALLLSEC